MTPKEVLRLTHDLVDNLGITDLESLANGRATSNEVRRNLMQSVCWLKKGLTTYRLKVAIVEDLEVKPSVRGGGGRRKRDYVEEIDLTDPDNIPPPKRIALPSQQPPNPCDVIDLDDDSS